MLVTTHHEKYRLLACIIWSTKVQILSAAHIYTSCAIETFCLLGSPCLNDHEDALKC